MVPKEFKDFIQLIENTDNYTLDIFDFMIYNIDPEEFTDDILIKLNKIYKLTINGKYNFLQNLYWDIKTLLLDFIFILKNKDNEEFLNKIDNKYTNVILNDILNFLKYCKGDLIYNGLVCKYTEPEHIITDDDILMSNIFYTLENNDIIYNYDQQEQSKDLANYLYNRLIELNIV